MGLSTTCISEPLWCRASTGRLRQFVPCTVSCPQISAALPTTSINPWRSLCPIAVYPCKQFRSDPVLGAPTQPHTQKKMLQVGAVLEEVDIRIPSWGIPLGLEIWWDVPVCVPLVVPAGVVAKPASQPFACLLLHARLVVSYCIHRAHSVFRAPRGCRVHTAH